MRKSILDLKKVNKIKTFGNSMFPLLRDEDIVYIKKIFYTKITVNDIICFKQKNNLVTHRVIYKSKNYILAKGDNNPFADQKVKPEKILGIVYAIKRGDQTINIDDIYLFQSSIYFEEIKKVVKIFGKENIDFVILKGLPLHLLLEKKHPRRIYADCDILVAKKDVKKLKKLLLQKDYRRFELALSEKHKKMKDKTVEESYAKQINGFPVVFDIHEEAAFMMTQLGRLNNLYPQNLLDKFSKHLLGNKRLVMIENNEFPLLSLEDQIIYLFLHLFHHNFRGSYRYDILLKIIDKPFNMEKIKKIIDTYKLANFVYSGLILLNYHYQHKKIKELIAIIDVSETVKKYVRNNILNTPIFDEEGRIGGGVKRFLLLFILSPKPLFLRMFTFLNPQVLYSVYWVVLSKIKSEIGFKLKKNFFMP